MNERRVVFLLIAGTAALRVVLASTGGLGFDESYMVVNSRSLSLSYVDHPPLHVWLVGGWARLLGSENALLLRLPFIALFAGSTWLMFQLTRQLFNARAGLWAALLMNLAPVFTLAHATWILPDGPLIFFALTTANIVARILFDEPVPSRPILWWIAAGVCGGLACLSKFHGVFLFLAFFAFLLTTPQQRRWLATPGPWLGVLAAVIVFSPAIIWNLQHGFNGLMFQAGRLSVGSGITLRYLPTNIGGQALYLAPWLLVPLAYCLGRALCRGPSAPKFWFFGLLAVGPVVAFTSAAFFAPSFPHWPMPGWLFAFPLVGEACVSLAQRRLKFMRYGTIFAAAVPALVIAALAMQATNGALGRTFPALFTRGDPTDALMDWHALGAALAKRKLIDAQTPAVAASLWLEAGKASYAIGRTIPVLCLCANPQHFAYLQQPAAFVGRNMILVARDRPNFMDSINGMALRFERIEPIGPVSLERGGEPDLFIQLYRGVNFKG